MPDLSSLAIGQLTKVKQKKALLADEQAVRAFC